MRFRQSVFVMSLVLFCSTVHASTWRFLPGLSSDYIAAPTLSFTAGFSGIDGSIYPSFGAELSFNCPLLQPPTDRIREQLSYSFTPSDNETNTHSVELNPHYIVSMDDGLWIGGGPALGLIALTGSESDTAIGAGLGSSVHYEFDQFFAGGEFRYLYAFSDGIDSNWRFLGKLGYRFR